MADKVRKYFGDGSSFGVSVKYSDEGNRLLGTAGAIKLLEQEVKDTVIVYYGDVLTTEDFDKVVSFHKDKKSDITVIVRRMPGGYRGSSIITIDGNKRIETFVEKPGSDEYGRHKKEQTYINNGIYVMEPGVLTQIPENRKCDLNKDVIPKLMKKGYRIYGYVSNNFFREIGRTEKYEEFMSEVRRKGKVMG